MTYETTKPQPKALLVGIPLQQVSDQENEDSLAELSRLATTLGFAVVKSLSQRRRSLSGATVVGQGKLKELAQWTGGPGTTSKETQKDEPEEEPEEDPEDHPEEEEEIERVDAVIFDCELTPSQLSNLSRALQVEVLDRTGVIVEIFSRHARTREAKLQVEIARLKYLAPRLRSVGGKRGSDRMQKAGESSLELDRRKIRDRIAELKQEILAVQKEQEVVRAQRSEQQCVALVGYTNAGKSSLMRALTGSQVLVEDKLFATLETTVRTLAPETTPRILVSDTVGFIRKLPHDLVASFRSTLEEARNAWLLLYVVDASDPSFRAQLQVTREVLSSLDVQEVPSLLVLNKCDKVEDVEALLREFPEAIALSAKEPADVARLRQKLIDFFESQMEEAEIFIPYTARQAVGALRSKVTVVSERYDENGAYFLVRGHHLKQFQVEPEQEVEELR